ncbi:hypothetical protein BLNAU_23567 [Blattamonas nauphoetae]|uniref:Uncharacterized protein n=1 Tax=Blattamonas nauphoetae TaxID=2049346 RepID=A0ABQ9WS01_9EUKA|nr:hypothetical protein BLNAU_23567 [Blattamonas nauphoetae]
MSVHQTQPAHGVWGSNTESTNHFTGTATLNVNHAQRNQHDSDDLSQLTPSSNDDVSSKDSLRRHRSYSLTTGVTRCTTISLDTSKLKTLLYISQNTANMPQPEKRSNIMDEHVIMRQTTTNYVQIVDCGLSHWGQPSARIAISQSPSPALLSRIDGDSRRHCTGSNQHLLSLPLRRHKEASFFEASTSFGNGVTLVAVGMTDSSGNSAFTRSITTEWTVSFTGEGRNDYPIDLLGILTHFKLSHPFKLFICKHHLSSFGTEDNVHIFDLYADPAFIPLISGVLSNTRKSSNLSEVAISCKSNESAVALITSGGVLFLTTTRSSLKTQQTHRTLQERRIANSSTKPGSLSASLSLVEGLLQKDGQKYNQTGFKVRGELKICLLRIL